MPERESGPFYTDDPEREELLEPALHAG